MKKMLLLFVLCLALMQAQALNIALVGSNSNTDVASWLQANGHSVTNFGTGLPSSLSGYQTVILLRADGNDVIKNFVLGGGRLVTEWVGADWAANQGLLNVTITGGGNVGSGIPITFNAAGIAAGLSTNVSNPYSDSARTDFFRYFGTIGSGAQILATYSGSTAAIVAGASGSGSTLMLAYDWADGFASANANTKNLILNAVNYSAIAVPEPSTWILCGLLLLVLGYKKRIS